VKVRWLGRACVEIIDKKNILIDPNYQIEPKSAPDIVLVTHEHGDHFDPELWKQFSDADLYAPQSVYDKFDVDGELVDIGGEVGPGIQVLPCDCYNSDFSVAYFYKGVLHTADAAEFPDPGEEVKLCFSACFSDLYADYVESCQRIEPELVIPYHYDAHDPEGVEEATGLIAELRDADFNTKLLELGGEIKI
jgi:L-ascorbate metabolism protein UlaG (beta-lactamase superfamily)